MPGEYPCNHDASTVYFCEDLQEPFAIERRSHPESVGTAYARASSRQSEHIPQPCKALFRMQMAVVHAKREQDGFQKAQMEKADMRGRLQAEGSAREEALAESLAR